MQPDMKQLERKIYERMVNSSTILQFDNTENKVFHSKGHVFAIDTSRQGIESMMLEKSAVLESRRAMLKKAIADWNYFNSKQPDSKKLTKPLGNFAHGIAECKARVALTETELRKLNKMLVEVKEQERERQETVVKMSKARGIIKLKNGVPYLCDNRLLKLDDTKEGPVIVFEDTGEALDTYLDELAKVNKVARLAKLQETHSPEPRRKIRKEA